MEPLVCPLLNIVVDIRTSEKGDAREKDTTVNASWNKMQAKHQDTTKRNFLLRVVATQIT
jgi:hypothetical protein